MGTIILEDLSPTAKKEHKCIWCGQKIEKGDGYIRQKMIYDGEFHDNKFHVECAKASSDHLLDGEEFIPYDNERGGYPY